MLQRQQCHGKRASTRILSTLADLCAILTGRLLTFVSLLTCGHLILGSTRGGSLPSALTAMASGIAIAMAETYRGVMPFLISDVLRTLLFLFFPIVPLWLVGVIGGALTPPAALPASPRSDPAASAPGPASSRSNQTTGS
jgi:hypothetical protein